MPGHVRGRTVVDGIAQPRRLDRPSTSVIAMTRPCSKTRRNCSCLPARQYRKEFAAKPSAVTRATIYATALGIYELHLNGQRVGDAYFAPGWTDYRQRAYYQTYDVTPLVKAGENALGAWVADGWYSGYLGFGLLTGIGTEHIGRYTYGKTPALMAQLEIEYADGSRRRGRHGQVLESDRQGADPGGGLPDGRMRTTRARNCPAGQAPGLTTATGRRRFWPRTTATRWRRSTNSESAQPERESGSQGARGGSRVSPRPKLEAFPGVPVRVTEEITPIDVKEPEPGSTSSTWARTSPAYCG